MEDAINCIWGGCLRRGPEAKRSRKSGESLAAKIGRQHQILRAHTTKFQMFCGEAMSMLLCVMCLSISPDLQSRRGAERQTWTQLSILSVSWPVTQSAVSAPDPNPKLSAHHFIEEVGILIDGRSENALTSHNHPISIFFASTSSWKQYEYQVCYALSTVFHRTWQEGLLVLRPGINAGKKLRHENGITHQYITTSLRAHSIWVSLTILELDTQQT